jgi:hypothetical protein
MYKKILAAFNKRIKEAFGIFTPSGSSDGVIIIL